MKIQRGMRVGAVAVFATAALGLSACSAPGGDDAAPAEVTEEITAPVTPEEVAELGDVTLSVWADQGEQDLMDQFVPAFEEKYSNVTVDIQFKSYDDLTATVLNAMNSDDAPDVTQGNQGWATDGALVEAGLIRPLDDVAAAYGYNEVAGDAISQLQWAEGGSSFGSGTVFGMSPDNQMVGLFYNKSKLESLGLEVPRTLDELNAAMQTASDAGETALMLGNSDKAAAMQALSIVQGALTPAADTRDWITGAAGSDFNVDTNKQAVELLASWVSDGYVSSGYDGMSPDDAAANFAGGEGVFFVGGNWFAGTIADGAEFGFASGLDDGGNASSGSFGLPWHVGANSDETLAAIAFVGMVNEADTADMLASVNRVPIHPVSGGEEGSIFPDLLTASDEQLSGNGALYWYDWATDTMFDTFTSSLQEVLAGKSSADDLLATVQSDWDEFQEK